MVKWINLEQRYACNLNRFRDLFCASTSFHETFHQLRKDQDVVVTDWISTSITNQQRLCFFNMHIEKFGLIKCIEKQNYAIIKDGHHTIEWSLTPDGTFSGLFNVTCECTMNTMGTNTTVKLKIKVTAEGGGGWGLGSIVENTAADVVRARLIEVKKYFEFWIQFVLEALEKNNMAGLQADHSQTKQIIDINNNTNDDSIKSRTKKNNDNQMIHVNIKSEHNDKTSDLAGRNWPITFDLQNSNYPPSLLPNVNKSRDSLMKKHAGSPRIALKTINYPYDIEKQKKLKPKEIRGRSQKITALITIVSVVLISAVFIFVLLYYNEWRFGEEESSEE